jgi:hypothetical protein
MAKIVGKVIRSDLEGGMWLLETAAGERFQLKGDTAALRDGMTAEISGKHERNMMSLGMTGALFTVEKVSPR